VGMVTLLEYGQVIYGKDAEAEAIPPQLKEEVVFEEPADK
jgi:formate-nitrite transporter family protein